MHSMLLSLALLAAIAVGAEGEGDGPSPASAGDRLAEDLDADLLDDLDRELSLDPDTLAPAAPDGAEGARPSAGEDLGAAEEQPLSRISREMLHAESLLHQTQSGPPTQQLQQGIVAQIDDLLDELRSRPRTGGSSEGSSHGQATSRDPVREPDGGPEGGRKAPVTESTTRLDQGEARRPTREEMSDLMRRVWGELPVRDREQLIQQMNEGILPEYELQIEDYFRRLAEGAGSSP